MFKRIAKNTVSRSLEADFFPWRLIRSLRNGTIVLGYHGVALDEDISDPWIQRSQTPLSEFRAHLEFIGKHFNVICADETLEPSKSKRQVHLSFDDGYVGFADHAVPLLREYGFTASVYVVTDALENDSRLPPYIGRAALGHCDPGRLSLETIGFDTKISDQHSRFSAYRHVSAVLKMGNPTDVDALITELTALLPNDKWIEINNKYRSDRLMGWDTLKNLSASDFTVGAHTKSHLSLSNSQSKEDIRTEVIGSIESVRREIGTCDWFAYPNGTTEDWSVLAAEAVKDSGAKGAWTLESGIIREPNKQNHFRLPRYFVPRTQERFTLLLNTALVRN